MRLFPSYFGGGGRLVISIRLHRSVSYSHNGLLLQVSGVGLSVGLLVTTVNPAKTADSMPFGLIIEVGPRTM